MDKQVEFLVKLRDAAQMIADATNEYIDLLAPKVVKQENAVPEGTFNGLKYQAKTGNKLGAYETATAQDNKGEAFKAAFEVLTKAVASIKDRYHGSGYVYSYWIYWETIFRQKTQGAQAGSFALSVGVI
jgi:hypothetical protein